MVGTTVALVALVALVELVVFWSLLLVQVDGRAPVVPQNPP